MSKQQATRRQMLTTSSGVLSLAALSSMGVFADEKDQSVQHFTPKAKSVIYLFMSCLLYTSDAADE